MIRSPYVAGQFYSSAVPKLTAEIESCFRSSIGPGRLPEFEKTGNTNKFKGGVAPHAGYMYSGHEAAHLYLKMFETGFPDTVIILGPAHRAFSTAKIAVYCGGGFETPLGVCPIDKDLAGEIAAAAPFARDEKVHAPEHSLEVQIPFLQYIYGAAKKTGDLKIVPLCVADQGYETSCEAAAVLAEIIKKNNIKAAIIASSDFSHYIPADDAYKFDKYAIDAITELDMKKMYLAINKYDISMCGYGPISITVQTLKALYAIHPELLKYGTSGDVLKMPEVVGYAAISFTTND